MTVAPISDLLLGYTFLTTSFTLQQNQRVSRDKGGRAYTSDFGAPFWIATYGSVMLGHDDLVQAESQLLELDGAMGTFWAYDTRRFQPRKHSGGAFSDVGVIASIGVNNDAVTLSGLANGFTASIGDRLSIETDGGGRRLFSVVREEVVTVGGSLTIKIRPHLPISVSVGADVRFSKATVLMQVEPQSVETNDAGRALGTVNFKAVEVI
ncbi:hypothetical protein AB9F26_05190 [Falsihalocynthiibacter sp. BN13B15]|uniref:hypothetical protein n=1 Tax=Falsihalocynthiibacter sp. BN13B15 TaxID=3240871 RepID=UPI0035105E1E